MVETPMAFPVSMPSFAVSITRYVAAGISLRKSLASETLRRQDLVG